MEKILRFFIGWIILFFISLLSIMFRFIFWDWSDDSGVTTEAFLISLFGKRTYKCMFFKEIDI